MFEESPVFRSVAVNRFEPAGELEFGSGSRNFGSSSKASSETLFGGLQKPGLHTSSPSVFGDKNLSLQFQTVPAKSHPDTVPGPHDFGYDVVTPPELFNNYYERHTSFTSRSSPRELLGTLHDVLQRVGCDCRSIPSEARIEATHFVDYTMLTFDASVFSLAQPDETFLVEIRRRSGDCMKFAQFYSEVFTVIMDVHPDIVEPPSSAEAEEHTHTNCSSRVIAEAEEHELDPSAIPSRPGLRRSPSSSRGGVLEAPLPRDSHPFGPTMLSGDLLESLLAFCRSTSYEQQRQGLELLARIGAEPVNRKQLVLFCSDILGIVADLLVSRDCGIQHSACALLSHVLNAARGDTKTLFPESDLRSRSRKSLDSYSDDGPDARSMFQSVSSLLFERSQHVRDAASRVLGYVACETSEPELVKSPLYLTWLRQQLSMPGNRARSILERLGAL